MTRRALDAYYTPDDVAMACVDALDAGPRPMAASTTLKGAR